VLAGHESRRRGGGPGARHRGCRTVGVRGRRLPDALGVVPPERGTVKPRARVRRGGPARAGRHRRRGAAGAGLAPLLRRAAVTAPAAPAEPRRTGARRRRPRRASRPPRSPASSSSPTRAAAGSGCPAPVVRRGADVARRRPDRKYAGVPGVRSPAGDAPAEDLAALAPAYRATGRALHEVELLDELLADLVAAWSLRTCRCRGTDVAGRSQQWVVDQNVHDPRRQRRATAPAEPDRQRQQRAVPAPRRPQVRRLAGSGPAAHPRAAEPPEATSHPAPASRGTSAPPAPGSPGRTSSVPT
jgi:hypothetical protein